MRVVVSDPLGKEGLDWLASRPNITLDVATGLPPEQLAEHLKGADALIVRSGTQVTKELLAAGDALRIVGRAGIGVDNIDVEAATERGILVVNTPTANATTTAELAIAHLLSLSRKLPQADRAVRAGQWAAGRKLVGRELAGKTLGIVGFGQIGRLVAQRCRGLAMRVLAHDPFVTDEAARAADVEPKALDDLLAQSDYVTLHCPLIESTHHLLDAARLARMKKGAYLVNCARGGLVDEKALFDALKSGHIAGAALDVFEQEPPEDSPLLQLENVVATPHLGASTSEAQSAVAIAIARQVAGFLERGEITGAVNLPPLASEDAARLAPWQDLARHLGRILSALAPWAIVRLDVARFGKLSGMDARPLVAEALVGLLKQRVDVPVNRVNAAHLAEMQGITTLASESPSSRDYVSLLTITAHGREGTVTVSGTLLGDKSPRLVRIDAYQIEVALEGCLLVTLHDDKPGVIGALGTLLGQDGVNISRMQIGLADGRTEAMAVLGIGCPLGAATIEKVRKLPAMQQVWYVPA